MKLSNFNNSLVMGMTMISVSCSKSLKTYSYHDFDGRVFTSDRHVDSEVPQIMFDNDQISSKKFTIFSNDHVLNDFIILPKDASPSGKPTICVNNTHYFVIEDQNKLIYRYYSGHREMEIVFKAK